jgi:hypothetical protein
MFSPIKGNNIHIGLGVLAPRFEEEDTLNLLPTFSLPTISDIVLSVSGYSVVLIFLYVNHEDFQNLCAGMTAG